MFSLTPKDIFEYLRFKTTDLIYSKLTGKLATRPVVPNLWYSYPWGYAADRLRVRKNNIGNGGKHQKKELK
jgi:hypothetical protein